MAIVAGVDFGTLSVRVSIVDSVRGLIGSAVAVAHTVAHNKASPRFVWSASAKAIFDKLAQVPIAFRLNQCTS